MTYFYKTERAVFVANGIRQCALKTGFRFSADMEISVVCFLRSFTTLYALFRFYKSTLFAFRPQ